MSQMPFPHTPRHVAIVMPTEYGYNRNVLRGVTRFLYEGKQWVFLLGYQVDTGLAEALRAWAPHGIIAHVFNPASVELLKQLAVPVVNVSSCLPDTPFPRVGGDDVEIGRLGARHFLDRGFTRCGYIGYVGHRYSDDRSRGFCEVLAAAGVEVIQYPNAHKDRRIPVLDWIRSLPLPIGVMACSDRCALQVAMGCYQLGIRVPDEVALLGVDNDDLACDLAYPRLLSVAVPGEQIGYEAARLLDQLMNGGPVPAGPTILPPPGVVTRQSTDTLAVLDPDVSAALRFIRSRACEPIGVDDILRAVPVSRRVLERRFRKSLGRSLLEEIQRHRVELAKGLLSRTDLRVSDVAKRCGFSSAQRFIITFRTVAGTTPQAYRKALLGRQGLAAKRP